MPKNRHGNYELWDGDENLLPDGAVWLNMPKVAIVARELGVDFAPALVGFGRTSGRAVPELQGIIVGQEHSEMICEAFSAWAQQKAEVAAAKRTKQVVKRWEILTKGLMTQDRLQREYGQATAAS